MIKEGINIIYKDLKGGLSLYEVKEQQSKGDFYIKQLSTRHRGHMKYPKSFSSTLLDKNRKQRLFPLWLEFDQEYILMVRGMARYVKLQTYCFMEDGLSFDFYEMSTGKLLTMNFANCCEHVRFKN